MPYIVGVGSPTPFQDAESFSYMLYIMGMAMSIGQFANFECLVRTSFPRAYDQYSTPDFSEYWPLERLFTGVGNHWNSGDC